MMEITVSARRMIKNIIDYLKWSNLLITFTLNPCSWKIYFNYFPPNDLGPKMHHLIIRILMLRIELIIDDGSW